MTAPAGSRPLSQEERARRLAILLGAPLPRVKARPGPSPATLLVSGGSSAASSYRTRVEATHWSIPRTGREETQIEYKYALGSWDFVEKDGACGEIANRQLTLTYGSTGTQAVDDTVLNWRNVSPCGN